MASTVNQQHSFPAVPPSFSAGDHEMRDYYATQDAPRPTINQTPYLTPYLGFRARLSQAVINRWTILLLLVLVRLLFAIAGVKSSLSSARREALSACTQVENIGSSMASMPHYMSQGINEMTAAGVEKAVAGLMSMLGLSVTGVEEIVLFVIHMMTSTYLCLITLAVSGSLHAAVEIGNEISSGLNKTIDEVTDGMGNAVKSVTDGIDKMISVLSSVPFAPDFTKPSINLDDDINKLKALEVPPQLQQGLQDLNKSIPTFEDVQNFTDNVIRLPFEEVKKLIAGMDSFEFNRTLLPVPAKEQLTFCSEGNSINEFFDELAELEVTAKRVALAVLIVAAILVIVPMAWSETRRYRKMQERTLLINKGHDAMDVVYLASRPHSSTWGLWLGRRFGSTRRQTLVRWVVAYATSPTMLLLLSLGLAGLFSCLCQYLLLRSIQKKVPELTNQVADFAEKVVNSLNNASMSWSGGVNGAISSLDDDINKDILGWVNTTTSAVNGTLNEFVDRMSKALNDTFGGTVLYDPIKEVLNCLVGLKVAGFQKGLTWVQDHAHVEFPGVRNDTFSLGTLAKVSNSSTAAELLANPGGKTKDEISEAVDHVVRSFLNVSDAGNPYTTDPAMEEAPRTQAYPDTAAPPYEYPVNKAAPYTIQPRPFPTFEPTATAAPESQTEKVGNVSASHTVSESARPGHLRASSHGHLAGPSPLDERNNPFSDRHDEKRNPFSN
ncbi:uncharacterized protein BDR25DRAFT_325437 [Lindgomyces ingoldianus]|uniref:Uncharacterized protein n=1 Tax=Lindgomyces ingoldianus TaxID=673940 RepID=A0ACB6QUD2_9PLEO|nr:uncharacterized protein BDR25DRAFT_325437 [Lindgomyces ingoldianus]KAF2470619.1 hypothetical protein BDR25DRAFT_325437 [Lindgomyces ingoldianus]